MSMNYEDMTPEQVADAISGITDESFATIVGAETAALIQQIAQEAVDAGQKPVLYSTAPGATNTGAYVVVPNGEHVQTVSNDTKAFVMDADTSINYDFGPDSQIEYVVLGAGNNRVSFASSDGVTVATQGGTNTAISSNGTSNDKFILNGTAPDLSDPDNPVAQETSATIFAGEGDDVVVLNLGPYMVGSASVNGGDGFDQVNLIGSRVDHHFSIEDGKVVLHSDFAVTMEDMNVVVFDNNASNTLDLFDQVTVVAQDAQDSMAAKLYMIALGRQPIDGSNSDANLDGIKFWMQQFENLPDTKDYDDSVDHLARAFLACPEFAEGYGKLAPVEFVSQIFSNLNLGNNGALVLSAGGMSAAEYMHELEDGSMSREDVVIQIAQSAEADAILGVQGIQYVIDDFTA